MVIFESGAKCPHTTEMNPSLVTAESVTFISLCELSGAFLFIKQFPKKTQNLRQIFKEFEDLTFMLRLDKIKFHRSEGRVSQANIFEQYRTLVPY